MAFGHIGRVILSSEGDICSIPFPCFVSLSHFNLHFGPTSLLANCGQVEIVNYYKIRCC